MFMTCQLIGQQTGSFFMQLLHSGCNHQNNRRQRWRASGISQAVHRGEEAEPNRKNGKSGKTLKTSAGNIRLDAPRDRSGTDPMKTAC